MLIKNPVNFRDNRGYLVKNFSKLSNKYYNFDVKECFYSFTNKGVIRGMHYMSRLKKQKKIVSVIKGEILDVSLNINPNSKNFMKVYSYKISEKSHKNSLFIDDNHAHGFLSLSDYTIVLYLSSCTYDPNLDFGYRYDSFGFDWKIKNPTVSKRDLKLQRFDEKFF